MISCLRAALIFSRMRGEDSATQNPSTKRMKCDLKNNPMPSTIKYSLMLTDHSEKIISCSRSSRAAGSPRCIDGIYFYITKLMKEFTLSVLIFNGSELLSELHIWSNCLFDCNSPQETCWFVCIVKSFIFENPLFFWLENLSIRKEVGWHQLSIWLANHSSEHVDLDDILFSIMIFSYL